MQQNHSNPYKISKAQGRSVEDERVDKQGVAGLKVMPSVIPAPVAEGFIG